MAAFVTEVDFKGCRSEFITGAERVEKVILLDNYFFYVLFIDFKFEKG